MNRQWRQLKITRMLSLYEPEAYFCIKGSVGRTDLAKLVYVLEVDIFAESDSAIYPRFFNGLQLLSNLSTKECL